MPLKRVKLTTVPAVKCPINNKVRPVEKCKGCDAYKGTNKKSIKCIADEF